MRKGNQRHAAPQGSSSSSCGSGPRGFALRTGLGSPLLALMLVALGVCPAASPPSLPQETLQEEVNLALEAGVQWLLGQQYVDGSFAGERGYRTGRAAFSAYTLMHCGLAADHPSVLRAMSYAKQRPAYYTYGISSEVLALCAMGAQADEAWLAERVEQLIELQNSSGLYGYPVYPDGTGRPEDLSLAVFAALALDAAAERGLRVPDRLWRKMLGGLQRCWSKPEQVQGGEQAGFTYQIAEDNPSGSMTAAGLTMIHLCEKNLGTKLQSTEARVNDRMRQSAMAWLGARLDFTANPGNGRFQYYWIYSIERIGDLLQTKRFGSVEWYPKGATYLVGEQKDQGHWATGEGEWQPTVFALLFLSRANQPTSGGRQPLTKSWSQEDSKAPIQLRGHGDAPLVLSVDPFSKSTLERYAWEGDREEGLRVLRVDYFASPSADLDPTQRLLLASVSGDGSQASAQERFAMREELPANGPWWIQAELYLAAPTVEGAPVRLISEALPIVVDGVLGARDLEYSSQALANQLEEYELECSSQAPGTWGPALAFDGLPESSWMALEADLEPRLTLLPQRPLRARRLLISHHDPRRSNSQARLPSRLLVVVNGKHNEAREILMAPNPCQKSELVFSKLQKIKRLDIIILADDQGELGKCRLGFSEIELLR